MEASSDYPGVITSEGYAVGHLDDLGDGAGFWGRSAGRAWKGPLDPFVSEAYPP